MANKLSKAQQEVVDKMREGWYPCVIGIEAPLIRLRKPFKYTFVLNKSTFKALLYKGVIKESSFDGFTRNYQLTEKYKTETETK